MCFIYFRAYLSYYHNVYNICLFSSSINVLFIEHISIFLMNICPFAALPPLPYTLINASPIPLLLVPPSYSYLMTPLSHTLINPPSCPPKVHEEQFLCGEISDDCQFPHQVSAINTPPFTGPPLTSSSLLLSPPPLSSSHLLLSLLLSTLLPSPPPPLLLLSLLLSHLLTSSSPSSSPSSYHLLLSSPNFLLSLLPSPPPLIPPPLTSSTASFLPYPPLPQRY